MTNPNRSKKLPPVIRDRAVKAGRIAKAECRANGGSPEEGHAAFRSAYNVVSSSYRRATDSRFRARANKACREWRERQAKLTK